MNIIQPCWGLPETSVGELCNVPEQFFIQSEARRINDIGLASDAQFCFCFLPWKPFWLTQCRLHGAIQKQLSCQVEESRGGSSFKCSAYASVLRESGAQRTMNKDLRMARKGLPMGFRHGRRHSCLGYVPNLCILRLFFHHSYS